MRFWFKLGFGIGLIAILFAFVDWRESLDILFNVDPIFTLLALAILPLNNVISTVKWRLLLQAQGVELPTYTLLKYYWAGQFFNNYLPSSFGGDISRLALMHHIKRTAQVAASIGAERLTGFAILLTLSAVGLLMRPEYFRVAGLLQVLWMAVGAFIGMLLLFTIFAPQFARVTSRIAQNRAGIIGRVFQKAQKLNSAMAQYKHKKNSLFKALVLSIPFYVIIIIFNYFVFRAIGSDLSVLDILFIAPLIILISMVPFSINGLGVAEGAFVILYSQAGILPPEALAAALLRRTINIVVSLLGGVFWAGLRKSDSYP